MARHLDPGDPGPDHDHGAGREVGVHALEQLDRRGGDRERAGADASLGPRATARAERGAEQWAEGEARATGAGGGLERLADLSQHLGLAQHQRVETRCDPEQMIGGRDARAGGEAGAGGCPTGRGLEQRGLGLGIVRSRAGMPVELGAVARAQRHRLDAFAPQPLLERRARLAAERHPLQVRERGAAVADREHPQGVEAERGTRAGRRFDRGGHATANV